MVAMLLAAVLAVVVPALVLRAALPTLRRVCVFLNALNTKRKS